MDDQPGGTAAEDGAGAEVRSAVADAHRREWAYVLAATARVAGNLDLAEECVQDAYLAALDAWTRRGVPNSPGAWLTTAARRRALDVRRRRRTLHDKLPLLIEPEPSRGALDHELGGEFGETGAITDDRLRLVFTCCHPALGAEAQIALTLRLVCGLTTRQIAEAFLVSEATMAARVTRAKKKIAAAHIPYRVPETNELPDRLRAVLAVVHLVYTTGHTDPAGTELTRRELAQRAIDLARMLLKLMPDEREVRGLLALLLLTNAREKARTDAFGRLVLLEDQDRGLWPSRRLGRDRRVRGASGDRTRRHTRQLPVSASSQGRTPAPSRPDGRSRRGLPRGAGPDRGRRGTRLHPHPAQPDHRHLTRRSRLVAVTVPHDRETAPEPARGGQPAAESAARAELKPMETNDVLIVAIGTALFAVAFVVLYPMHASLERDGHGRWPWIALSGALLGLLGLLYCLRRVQKMSKVNAQ